MIVQVLAFLRQLLIAAYFGISRDVDVYVIAYAIVTIIVFTFSTALEFAVVPRLVRARKQGGEEAARTLAVSMFRWACAIGLTASALLIVVTPLLTPIIAAGFDAADRIALDDLVRHFIPWTVLCLPFYVATAQHKARRNFNRVFVAEIVICVVSITILVLLHDRIEVLPWAYAGGYAAALACVLPGTGILPRLGVGQAAETPSAVRNVGELYLANQTGSAMSLVERHFQSLVSVGSIAAVNYSVQITMGLMSLLTFREIYLVPLAETERRDEKLERLLIGLVVLATLLSSFVALMAHDIIEVLFQRGKFDAAATILTASILNVVAFTMIPAAATMPLVRMFQIMERIRLIHVYYLFQAACLGIFGFIFVVVLGWGVRGLAWMMVSDSAAGFIVSAVLAGRCGITVRWGRVGRYAVFVAVVSVLAVLAGREAASWINGAWGRLCFGGITYGAVASAALFLIRARLKVITG